jgi:tetratricopeptide (TPR) repeat protein
MARSFGKEAGVAPWSFFYEGLEKAREGKLDDAEKAFESAAAESGDWRLAANIAALYEAERKAGEALRRYEVAASLCASNADAAEIQLRIARLQKVLGRDTDARRTLEYALSKDPGNRRVRMELKRLNGL